MCIDVCPNHERHDVEERDPGMLGQELLGKRQCQWRGDPADLHDWHETGLDGGSDLVECPGTGDDCH